MGPVPLPHPAVASVAAVLAAIGLLAAGCGGAKTTTSTNAQGQTVVSCQISFAKTVVPPGTRGSQPCIRNRGTPTTRGGPVRPRRARPDGRRRSRRPRASGLVVVHELKIAAHDAQCDGPALKALAQPISAAIAAAGALTAVTGGGGLGSIGTAGAAFDELKSAAAAAGASIKQR